MRLFSTVLFFMINIAICLTSTLEHDTDNPLQRIGRAAPTTRSVKAGITATRTALKAAPTAAPSVNKKPPTIRATVERHMKLARVFNALYLQMQLADEKIDNFDVIAGIWNLKDKKVIDELISLKVDGLTESLKKLNTAIKGADDGLTQVADVKGMEEKMKSIREITAEMRKQLVSGGNITNIPFFIQADNVLPNINLKINLAQKAIDEFDIFDKKPIAHFFKGDERNLRNALEEISNFLDGISRNTAALKLDSEKSLTALVNGMTAALNIKKKAADLQQLSKILNDALSRMGQFQQLTGNVMPSKINQELGHVQNVIQLAREPPLTIPIGSAFISNHNLSIVSQDLKDSWLLSVLNNGRHSEKFKPSIEHLESLSNRFDEVKKYHSQLWNLRHDRSIKILSKSVGVFQKFQTEVGQYNPASDNDCYTTTENKEPLPFSDIEKLSSDVDAVSKSVPNIQQILNSMTASSKVSEEFNHYTKLVGAIITTESFTKWKNSTERSQLKVLLDDSKTLFDSLGKEDAITEPLNRLMINRLKILSTQEWVAGFKQGSQECDPLFSLDVSKFHIFNEVPESVKVMKAETPVENILSLLESFPRMVAELKQLKSLSSSPQKPAPQTGATQSTKTSPKTMTTQKPKTAPKKSKRSTSSDGPEFKSNDPQNLLEFAFSARSLEVMEEVHRHDKAIETILKTGDSANKMIGSIVDPELKAKLKDAWKGFDATKASLKAIQGDIKKVFAKIGATMEESTLKEVGATYEELGAISKAKYNKILLSGYRQSLMDIPSSNSDPNWKALEEAFEELERPASMDFEMSFAHFRKVPSALVALQDDLKNFFENDGSNDGEKGFLEKNLIIILCSVGIPVLISIIASVVGLVYYCKYYYDPEMKKKLPRDEDWVPTDAAIEKNYTYMQYQDDRFEINQRLPNGNTKVFNLMTNRDWDAVEELVKQGAILDATCNGNKHRTALYELVLMKEPHWCKFFLDAGADQTIHDFSGDDADTWADTLGYFGIFQRAFDERKNKLPERNLAYEPRPWNVLVFDAKCIPRKLRKKLPARIKQNTTWGYKEGMKLDDFTIIIMPKKYLHDEKTIALSDDDLMTYKLYGCAASLVNVSFFHELIKNPKKHAEIMSEDYNHWIFNTYYKKEEYKDTVFKHKTNIHRMQPKLFDGIMIWFYETKDKQALAKQDDWTEIIKFFGGKVVDKPIPDPVDGEVPYHTMGEEYKDTQNCMWLIKYDDSKVPNEHIRDPNQYTVFKLGILGACFSRYVILSFINDIFPRETEPTPENDTGSTTGATTKDGDSTMSKTVGNNATAGTISISTTTSKLEAPGGKTKSQMVRATRNKMEKPKNFVIRKGGRKMSVEGATNVPVSLAAPATQPAKPKDNIRGRMSKQSAQKA